MFVFRKLFAFIAPYDCRVCGKEGDLVCVDCLPGLLRPPTLPELIGLDRIWAISLYEGALRDLVHTYKFERGRDIARVLALALHITAPAFSTETLVSYVPTATSRVRQRGYDQAAELAKAFASHRKLRCIPLLRRYGHARQVGSSRHLRRKQLHDAYAPKNIERIKDARILLIDDVLTTGASLESAAKILRQAGCGWVDGLVVAYKK